MDFALSFTSVLAAGSLNSSVLVAGILLVQEANKAKVTISTPTRTA